MARKINAELLDAIAGSNRGYEEIMQYLQSDGKEEQ